jgi:hypothetical protein
MIQFELVLVESVFGIRIPLISGSAGAERS